MAENTLNQVVLTYRRTGHRIAAAALFANLAQFQRCNKRRVLALIDPDNGFKLKHVSKGLKGIEEELFLLRG